MTVKELLEEWIKYYIDKDCREYALYKQQSEDSTEYANQNNANQNNNDIED